MQIFVIEAYGGPDEADGSIMHFTVQMESAGDAVNMIRRSPRGSIFQHFEVVSETPAFEPDELGIIEENDGP